ncbi:uncharacterized protein HMPREF1541_01845 [Cyphellophora europaea CBS 101466]|uniref:Uncharacterized protein n=1 Tax=Cyphellophora europaea (strain CBS 101466) TaxID=1220924 RepID=W2S1X5_CYPE1|nr:uncharacterized protein HMPREF1541_01845 [Cyphellophora europaea CBS 101466]ETN42687.1 hypothetical protein HMPREF1541_01845 [Cyphellophora europaea CBS 101466]
MAAAVCPVVGTTNTVLPPTHPEVDLNKDGLVCPVTNATTDHHHNLLKHPSVPGAKDPKASAEECPALQKMVSRDEDKERDEGVCPVVGTATSVLPPDHPSLNGKTDDKVCPVTKAKLGDHKDKIHQHPPVENASKDAVCPVAGVKAK